MSIGEIGFCLVLLAAIVMICLLPSLERHAHTRHARERTLRRIERRHAKKTVDTQRNI